jgi:hypothetical protein
VVVIATTFYGLIPFFVSLVASGKKTGADAARLFRVHPSTVVRLLAKYRLDDGKIA